MKVDVSLSTAEVQMIVSVLREKAAAVRAKANDPLNHFQADLIDQGLVDDVKPGKAHDALDRLRIRAAEMDGIADRLYRRTLD
jgi:hypothetical protein